MRPNVMGLGALSAAMGLVASCNGASGDAAPLAPEIAECTIDGVDAVAECGRIFVFENRAARSGRKIPIEFIRVRATGSEPASDPVFLLTGGPGEIAVERAGGAIAASPALAKRDIVVIDQRGAGKSNGLDCVKYDLESRPEAFREMFEKSFFDTERFRACMERLGDIADLRFYTTSLIADDIDDLRAALGYEQINLDGGSYGTTLALEIIRRHGAHVRAAVLAGAIPPAINQTETLAPDTDAMLEALFRDCAGDAACARAFPDLRADFHAVIERVRAGPVDVELSHTLTAAPVAVRVRYPELAVAIRYALYSTKNSAGLPLAVAQAKASDFRKLTALLPRLLYFLAEISSEGLWASVRCAEEFPYLDIDRARARAEGTLMGAERIDSGAAICSFWPRGAIPANFHEPVRSSVPVLLLAGEVDAATPPWMSEAAAKHLPNGRLLVVPNSSHWELGGDCIDGIVAEFLNAGSAADLDTACVADITRPPFELP